jgi:hypothetical protein
MVSIGIDAPRNRTRVLTLGERIAQRDASIAVRIGVIALAGLRGKRFLRAARTAGGRAIVMVFAVLGAFGARHGLVLGALTAFTVAAWRVDAVAGLVTMGVGMFFLELRRK